jgi:hypothetical protein
MKIIAAWILFLTLFLTAFRTDSSSISAHQTKDGSLEEARSTLVHLIQLSDKQALRTEEAQRLLVGEMLSLNIPTFGKLTNTPDKMLMLEKNRAIGRVQRFGENNQITDVYFYLQYDGSWKVSEVRLLALTGIIEQLYFALKAKTSLTEEEKNDLANMKLILASDKDLKAWFSENRESLDKLYSLVQSKAGKDQFYIRSEDKQFPEVAMALKKLHLSGMTIETNGNVEMVIGGVTDNVVGFIYSPSKNPPAMSPSSYIWVEEVADKWYLFRTT